MKRCLIAVLAASLLLMPGTGWTSGPGAQQDTSPPPATSGPAQTAVQPYPPEATSGIPERAGVRMRAKLAGITTTTLPRARLLSWRPSSALQWESVRWPEG